MSMRTFPIIALLLAVQACTYDSPDGEPDASDGDADTDADSDTDTDADSDSDTGEDPFYTDPSGLPQGDDPCREPVLVKALLDVVDGDTIWVDMEEGPHEKIRFIGVDTPEIGYDGDPDECFAQEAKEFTQMRLEQDRFWLTFDEECLDIYDRTLAYIHTREGMFQLEQLKGGFAEVMTVPPNDTFQLDFEQAEDQAQEYGNGMWGECR